MVDIVPNATQVVPCVAEFADLGSFYKGTTFNSNTVPEIIFVQICIKIVIYPKINLLYHSSLIDFIDVVHVTVPVPCTYNFCVQHNCCMFEM